MLGLTQVRVLLPVLITRSQDFGERWLPTSTSMLRVELHRERERFATPVGTGQSNRYRSGPVLWRKCFCTTNVGQVWKMLCLVLMTCIFNKWGKGLTWSIGGGYSVINPNGSLFAVYPREDCQNEPS
uniref:Uncharacterized protein n=1 Tax=Opuntia streptacantha TaxID=393608 RepID=A0A7C9F1E6_OPUST